MYSPPNIDTHHVDNQDAQPQERQLAVTSSSLLLQLPDTAKHVVCQLLSSVNQKQLRLVCKDARVLVDTMITEAAFELGAPMLQPQRFPQMAHLTFDLMPNGMRTPLSFNEAALELDLAARMPAAPWPRVTGLRLHGLNEADTVCVASRCPGVKELLLFSVATPGNKEERPRVADTDTLRRVCASLPLLQSYISGCCLPLSDPELCTLAGCCRLVSLNGWLGSVSQVGWGALAGMAQLQKLDVVADQRCDKTDERWDLRNLTALTSFEVHANGGPDSALYEHLQLPSNLVQLSMNGMPQPAWPLMPHLTSLTISEHDFVPHMLRTIALSCPNLTYLGTWDATFAEQCNLSPLAALRQLYIGGSFSAAAGVRLGTMFPALRSLQMNMQCDMTGAGPHFFLGATALEELDCARNFYDDQDYEVGLSMDASYFEVLARLPRLQALRMKAEPAHIRWLRLLRPLRRLGLVFAMQPNSTDAPYSFHEKILEALTKLPPHKSLEHAHIEFTCLLDEQLSIFARADHYVACTCIADAIAAWLVQSPAMTHVSWCAGCMDEHTEDYVGLNDLRFLGIALNPSVRSIQMCGGLDAITPAVLQRTLARGPVPKVMYCSSHMCCGGRHPMFL